MANIRQKSFVKKSIVGAVVATILASQPMNAAPVLLESDDGIISIAGELVNFDGTHYLVGTELGELRVLAGLVSCSGAGCPAVAAGSEAPARPERPPALQRADLINISGSDAVGGALMPLLVAGYADTFEGVVEADRNNDVEKVLAVVEDQGFGERKAAFRIMSSISSDAFANLLGRSTEIGMSSEPIPTEKADLLRRAGAGEMRSASNEHIVALDSIVVITHPENPIKSVTMSQLSGIYSGEITNWSELGGPNEPIKVVQRAAGTSTQNVFEDRVFADQAGGVPASLSVEEDFESVADAVYADTTAMAYVPLAQVRGNKPMNLVNECGMEMVPDAFSARTEEYNLGRFLYLYSRNDTLSPEGADFLDYVKSSDAESVILKAGYIDLGVERQAQELSSPRALRLRSSEAGGLEATTTQKMLAAMSSHDRLSSTFRFATGSDRLTDRGQLNLERLADFAETLPEGSRLVFVGFADSVGPFQNNLRLSQARAERILRAFKEESRDRLNGVALEARAFSELAPAACNTTDEGRAINRRVEVWIANDS